MQRSDDMFRLRIGYPRRPDAGISFIDDFKSQEMGILFSEPLVNAFLMQLGVAPEQNEVIGLGEEHGHRFVVRFDTLDTISFTFQKEDSGRS